MSILLVQNPYQNRMPCLTQNCLLGQDLVRKNSISLPENEPPAWYRHTNNQSHTHWLRYLD